MARYLQHFVSQHLGRGIGNVVVDEQGDGIVELAFSDPARRYALAFSVPELAARHPGKTRIEALALRLAIGQLHRDLRKPAPVPGSAPQRLVAGVAPWLGDFADGPFVGGTVGYLRRNGVMQERRTGNDPLEACVEHGLLKRKSEGRRAARGFLELARVPEAIIRRVLSHTAQRRKTRSEGGTAIEPAAPAQATVAPEREPG